MMIAFTAVLYNLSTFPHFFERINCDIDKNILHSLNFNKVKSDNFKIFDEIAHQKKKKNENT